MSGALFAAHALLPAGWRDNVLLRWDDSGRLSDIHTTVSPPPDTPRARGPLIPGMPNLHSHAFQRAFAGLTEYRDTDGGADDSFWTWRDRMYRVANSVTPEQLEAIATHLYIEMLHAGYTAVCEFHYLHHDAGGGRYADPAEMSLRLVAAAQRAGIGLTLLPVLYQHAGFGASRRAAISGASSMASTRCSSSSRGCAVNAALRVRRRRCVSASRRIRCALSVRPRCASCWPASSRSIRACRCTCTSPSRNRKCTIASAGAASARCNGCSRTPMSMHAGAWCMQPT